MPTIPGLGRWTEKDQEFKASLNYIDEVSLGYKRPCPLPTKKQK